MTAYAGFDRSDYPGPAAMRWLREHTNLRWCGFYLGPAPSHPNTSWMTADDADFDGWGFAPIYVGRQVIGPGARLTAAGQGAADGKDAARLMALAGFDRGSVVYVDLENGPPFGPLQQAYVGEICDSIAAEGYVPGVYCSFLFARQVRALRPAARIWVFHVRTVAPHRIPGETLPAPEPSASGFAAASVWQHDDEAIIPCAAMPGGVLIVDLDSADSPDPSS